MSMKSWEKKVLERPGAKQRVREIEDELRLAAGLTALREEESLSQRELANRIGVSQPRVAAIEQSRNITLDVLEQYVEGLGGRLEVNVVKGTRKVSLVGGSKPAKKATTKAAKRLSTKGSKGSAQAGRRPARKAAAKRRSA